MPPRQPYTHLARLECGCERLVNEEAARNVATAADRIAVYCSGHGIQTVLQVQDPETRAWSPDR